MKRRSVHHTLSLSSMARISRTQRPSLTCTTLPQPQTLITSQTFTARLFRTNAHPTSERNIKMHISSFVSRCKQIRSFFLVRSQKLAAMLLFHPILLREKLI